MLPPSLQSLTFGDFFRDSLQDVPHLVFMQNRFMHRQSTLILHLVEIYYFKYSKDSRIGSWVQHKLHLLIQPVWL